MEIGGIHTPVGEVKRVSTTLSFKDKFDGCKVRWGINRYNYKISTGIYAVGNPDDKSPVLVTANYKLTFDYLRRELKELNLWILVIDTKGINVWCAAGKGTFGNYELLKVINKVKLKEIISHNTLILPLLTASIKSNSSRIPSSNTVAYLPILSNVCASLEPTEGSLSSVANVYA